MITILKRSVAGAILLLCLASPALGGHGWGHRNACRGGYAGYGDCGSCDEGVAGGSHGLNSYIHGHRLVRFWGGPKHPLPPLSGTPGFWDQPGWFNTDASGHPGGAWTVSPPMPAGQVLGGR